MNPISRPVLLAAGLTLLLLVSPSWAANGSIYFDNNDNAAGGDPNQLFNGTFTGSDNTGLGRQVMPNLTTGSANTAIGSQALQSNTTGLINTAVGVQALQFNTTGTANTAIGSDALQLNTTGTGNIAIGSAALESNTTGNHNTATGFDALDSNTTGNNNTAMGSDSLVNNTIGNLNTATGFQALESNIAGNNNTAIGAKALKKSLGTKNIGIGFQAGVSLVNGNNNIYIGNQGAGDEFQTIRVGTAQTSTFIAGINTATVGDAQVMVDTATGQLGIVTSSARYKRDIETMASRSEGLLKLRPVSFSYKDDTAAAPHYGLIAEEVATVYPELVTRTATGEVQTVKYHELIPMLLNELQRLQTKVTALEALVGSRLEK